MTAPIQSGDTAEVIQGLVQHKSPNIGKRVLVGSLQGEHSQFGRVWRCTGSGIQQLTDVGGYASTGWADFPAAWLRKVDPDSGAIQTSTQEELSA